MKQYTAQLLGLMGIVCGICRRKEEGLVMARVKDITAKFLTLHLIQTPSLYTGWVEERGSSKQEQ